MRAPPLTEIAKQRVAECLHDGSLAVDATVGNGHDTLFLAECVGSAGHVWGFDVQADALAAAAAQLAQHGIANRVTLIHTGHQDMAAHLPGHARGRLDAVMFNLGYLPGSDKRVTTVPDTTLAALAAAAANLAPGGVLSVLAYCGHPGGQAEADAVRQWLDESGLEVEVLQSPGPVLYLAHKILA